MIRQSSLLTLTRRKLSNFATDKFSLVKNVSLTKLPALGGKIKQELEDFQVFEIDEKGSIAGITPISEKKLEPKVPEELTQAKENDVKKYVTSSFCLGKTFLSTDKLEDLV